MTRHLLDIILKILIGALLFSLGLIVSRLLFHFIGLSPPRMPFQAPESIAGYYLLIGSMILAAGLISVDNGLGGSRLARWGVLSGFLIICFCISTSIENMIYMSAEGSIMMIPILILPSLLLSGVISFIKGYSAGRDIPSVSPKGLFQTLKKVLLTRKLFGAVIIFPVLYFIFGILVSPLVVPYYEQNVSGLALPGPLAIVTTEIIRGGLHVLAVIPIMFFWHGTMKGLTISLSLSFFIFVMAYDVVLAYQVPLKLIITHGMEMLIKSFIYGWLLVKLLAPDITPVENNVRLTKA